MKHPNLQVFASLLELKLSAQGTIVQITYQTTPGKKQVIPKTPQIPGGRDVTVAAACSTCFSVSVKRKAWTFLNHFPT